MNYQSRRELLAQVAPRYREAGTFDGRLLFFNNVQEVFC